MVASADYLGMVLCVGGSWGSNMANIYLKCKDNANDARERDGEELLPMMNYYNFMYVFCYACSAVMDQTSLVLIPQSLWAAISALDVIWYSIFTAMFLDDPLEFLEMIPLGMIVGAIVLTVIYGVEDTEKTKSGYEYLMDADPGRILAFFPAFFIITALLYLAVYRNFKAVKSDPVKYPPGYMPNPKSSYNIAGLCVNGISTALFCTSMYLLNNSVFTYLHVTGAAIIFFVFFLPFTAISFMTDWFAAAELHIITVVPASLIVNALVQFAMTQVLFEDAYADPKMFYLGCGILFISLIIYVLVEEYEWNRDRHAEEQEVQEYHDHRHGIDRDAVPLEKPLLKEP